MSQSTKIGKDKAGETADDRALFGRWSERPASAACFSCGILAVFVLFGRQVALDDLLGTPPLTHSLPFVGLAVAFATASLVRRERSVEHLLLGVGLAVAGIFLGWVLAGALGLALLWFLIQVVDILD